MKVIFLDVDGVLNSEKDLLEAKGKSELFDRPLALLKELVESTKAKIVVSSTTWMLVQLFFSVNIEFYYTQTEKGRSPCPSKG